MFARNQGQGYQVIWYGTAQRLLSIIFVWIGDIGLEESIYRFRDAEGVHGSFSLVPEFSLEFNLAFELY